MIAAAGRQFKTARSTSMRRFRTFNFELGRLFGVVRNAMYLVDLAIVADSHQQHDGSG
jgi:hypothetical protein